MDSILGRIFAMVMGLIVLGGVAFAIAGGMGTTKTTGMVENTAFIQSAARQVFGMGPNGYANFTTANTADLVKAGIFPPGMVRGGVIYDSWGNAVTMSSANGGTQQVLGFGGGGSESVKDCIQVATGLKGYTSLTVGSTTFTPSNPPDAVSASQACTTGLTFQVTAQ